jgi:probable phosphoglycerate mutase
VRLAHEHAGHPFDIVYATPRRRVRETADIVTRALGLSAVVEAELLGPDHGDADGRPWQELKTAYGGPPQHNPDLPYAPGSESWTAYLDGAAVVTEKNRADMTE